MKADPHIQRAGASTPAIDEAPAVAAARGFGEQGLSDGADFRSGGVPAQVALTVEGEAYADAHLDRLQRGTVSPDDLAVMMAFLHGEMLAGACRVIVNALRGGRHG